MTNMTKRHKSSPSIVDEVNKDLTVSSETNAKTFNNSNETRPLAKKNIEGIMDNILDNIGWTPLVRLNKLGQEYGLECELLAKCEFFNSGGSVKDRIGKRMLLDAEASGRIKPGDTLIEPTSGNTGIGLSLAAAIKGYKMIITLPEKMSQEKVDVLKGLGADIIRTPTEAAWDAPESHISVAKRLRDEIPNAHILDQYANPSNPLAHYEGTAEELLIQCDGKIDMVVMGAGTGGTITGVAKKLKERLPGIQVVGADPKGSILAQPAGLNGEIVSYQVEGIGYDFIPQVLERQYIDDWVKTEDTESFQLARKALKDEGLMCGGSSGSALAAALKAAKKLKKGQRCVVVLPDSIRNYMSKFLDNEWMIKNSFMKDEDDESTNPWWASKTVSDLPMSTPITVSPEVQCRDAVTILESNGFDQLPVVDSDNTIRGMATIGNLMSKISTGRLQPTEAVGDAVYKQFSEVQLSTPLKRLSKMFDKDPFAVVVATQKTFVSQSELSERQVVVGVVTRVDLLNYIIQHPQ